ncbi:hypothetical protein [Thermoactinomyces sp. CICC 10521]|uniref:hypothetical protein n=1 Tax=Thermoactinomyces sp. CICC 10521 TaxID=2767426 RepID=UPI0018DD5BEF|nr:hypothetical protein [Thermoactinomyces sp. CICC 10521]MBH8609416.1 hypothetical protein [Thermoactinomyces sp. CICC 10521]
MKQFELSIQDKTQVIKNPTWEQIFSILSSLDGKKVSQASLKLENVGFMTVAGGEFIEEKGQRLYIVEFFDGQGEFNTLVNPDGDPDEYIFLATGQVATDIADIHLVGFQKVVKAFEHFYQTGELSNELDWE